METKSVKSSSIKIVAMIALAMSFSAQAGGAKKSLEKRQPSSVSDRSIWVARPSGALSCEPGSGEPLKKGADELSRANIPVLDSKAAMDGLVHIQMCGAPQGTNNAYLISESHREAALALGFEPVK